MAVGRLAVAFLRVAAWSQDGSGLDAQRAACERVAVEQGYRVVVWIEAAGVGSLDDVARAQGEYLALVDAIRSGAIGAVIVADMTCLSRSQHCLRQLAGLAERHGVVIVSADGIQ